MAKVIDFHVQILPNPIQTLAENISFGRASAETTLGHLQNIRRQARGWIKPLMGSLHELHSHLRYLPEVARKNLDEFSRLVPLPGLLVESTLTDLKEAMTFARVDQALAIAHPPLISNEFLLELASLHPEIIPGVNIPKGVDRPIQLLKKYFSQGARALKIHPALDQEGPDSPRYRALIRTASDLGLPIILHTGSARMHLFYKPFYKESFSRSAEQFSKWFENYPRARFVLAHMNFHEPSIALDLCEEFENVHVDTSWQPAEVVSEAVRRIGAERVLFGSDWPVVGDNMTVGRQRIQNCIASGLLNDQQASLILGDNARKLLGLNGDAHRAG
jgi:predicted TIM-barrel fold metal-dependent hydrolase